MCAVRPVALVLAVLFGIIALTGMPTKAQAQTQAGFSAEPLIVHNDRGGLLRARLRQISELRAQGRRVEIRGSVCYSTCTMLIGLPDTCVAPTTVFGFHGPGSYGRTLDRNRFNYASEVISNYYPPALKVWYMQTARYTIGRVHRVKGAQLIALGVPEC